MKLFNKGVRKGFTVLELLVAMSVTAGIVVLLTSVTRVALDTYKQSSDEMRSSRMSQAALNDLANDLNSIVITPNNPNVWLSVKGTDFNVNNSAEPTSVELCFFSAVTDRYNGNTDSGNLGDISAIRYVVGFNDSVGEALGRPSDSRVLNFYRQRIDPDITYRDIISNLDSSSNPDFLSDLFSASRTESGSLIGDAEDSFENFLAENVYEFTITFEIIDIADANARPKFIVVSSKEVNSDYFLVRGNGIESPNSTVANINGAQWRLRSINVGMTLVSDQGMDLISVGARISEEDLTSQYANSYSVKVELPEAF